MSRVARTLLRVAGSVHGGTIPFDRFVRLRELLWGGDPLLPKTTANATGADLRDPTLRRLLVGEALGEWSLGPRTIHLIDRLLRDDEPGLVLEFGSGTSTACVAWSMKDIGRGTAPSVVSIEQDGAFASRTRAMLQRLGLDEVAAVIHAPLSSMTVAGTRTVCYDLPSTLKDVLGERSVDLVIIDGPAGPSGARFATLPLARPFASADAVFLLDDALRDSEIETAVAWRELAYVEPEFVFSLEKGVLRGRLHGLRRET